MTESPVVLPEPSDPEYVRFLRILNCRAEGSRARKAEALDTWARETIDEELRDRLGLDLDALRDDPLQET